jgi:hypothetical protein
MEKAINTPCLKTVLQDLDVRRILHSIDGGMTVLQYLDALS